MKKVMFFLLYAVAITDLAYAQWTEPIGIMVDSGNYTGSVFANCIDTPYPPFDPFEHLAFCKTDSGRSSIYLTKTQSDGTEWGTPTAVVSDPLINYDSPAMAYRNNQLLMVYRAQTNPIKLYAMLHNGVSWSVPECIASDSVSIGEPYAIAEYGGFALVWVQRGIIKFMKHNGSAWLAPVNVTSVNDSLNFNPQLSLRDTFYNVVWEKQKTADTSRALMYAYGSASGWSVPRTLFLEGDNRNPRFIKRHWEKTLTYESNYFGDRKIFYADGGDTTWQFVRDTFHILRSGLPSEASYSSYPMIVKKAGEVFPDTYVGCLRMIDNDSDRIVLECPGEGYAEVNTGEIDRHPAIGHGLRTSSSNIRFWAIWESNAGGHWGIYGSRIYIVIDVHENEYLPGKVNLYQNYPNPFNPGTRIDYELSAPGQVSITVYNALGQHVREILNRYHNEAGVYNIYWDGKNERGQALSSGIYLYRLQTGSYTKTMKMLMVK